jgi:hypothetical protein
MSIELKIRCKYCKEDAIWITEDKRGRLTCLCDKCHEAQDEAKDIKDILRRRYG